MQHCLGLQLRLPDSVLQPPDEHNQGVYRPGRMANLMHRNASLGVGLPSLWQSQFVCLHFIQI